MKAKLMVLLFCVAAVLSTQVFAQTQTDASRQTNAPTAQADTKTQCPCCQQMADSKDAKSCCHHHKAAKGEKTASCCGSDAQSCMKGDKDKSAACAGGNCCCGAGKDNCCGNKDQTTETAMACCRGAAGHCGMSHNDHNDINQ